MTFLLDQDVPDAIARVLHQSGQSAVRLREIVPTDAADEVVLAAAAARQAILVTCNRDDFLALAQTRPHTGIIILIRRASRAAEGAHLLRLLQTAGESGLSHNINFA
jgi:predicted nuclease of predicted toxin-antitoxin system